MGGRDKSVKEIVREADGDGERETARASDRESKTREMEETPETLIAAYCSLLPKWLAITATSRNMPQRAGGPRR